MVSMVIVHVNNSLFFFSFWIVVADLDSDHIRCEEKGKNIRRRWMSDV